MKRTKEKFSVIMYSEDFEATFIGENFSYEQAHSAINMAMDEMNREFSHRKVEQINPTRERVELNTFRGFFYIDLM